MITTPYEATAVVPSTRDQSAARLLRRQQWLGVAMASVLALLIFVVPAGRWAWDHDEIATLMEMGAVPVTRYPGPVAQLQRMHRLTPVFTALQRASLSLLPTNEWGTRLMPSLCGALVSIIAFAVGLRRRGMPFALSIFILTAGSQTLVWLSQQNRFYPVALLFAVISLLLLWSDDERPLIDAIAAAAGIASVLSHNLTLVLLGLSSASIVAAWWFGVAPRLAARRAVVLAVSLGALYVIYLRPLLGGWLSGDTGGTPPLVSLVAQLGITPLALAVPGTIAVWHDDQRSFHVWWIGVAAAGLAFVTLSPWILGNWNPRYALFFMLPIWVLAAFGSELIARRLATPALTAGWLLALVLLLAPKLASHFIDGSRHDLRSSANIVAQQMPRQPVLTNWPAELQYYLEPITGQSARYWTPGMPLPEGEAVVVLASNAWEPVLRLPGRTATIIGEIGRRRFDEQSHLVRIYRVSGPVR